VKATVPLPLVKFVTFQSVPTFTVLVVGARRVPSGTPLVPIFPVTVRVFAPAIASASRVPGPRTFPPIVCPGTLAKARLAPAAETTQSPFQVKAAVLLRVTPTVLLTERFGMVEAVKLTVWAAEPFRVMVPVVPVEERKPVPRVTFPATDRSVVPRAKVPAVRARLPARVRAALFVMDPAELTARDPRVGTESRVTPFPVIVRVLFAGVPKLPVIETDPEALRAFKPEFVIVPALVKAAALTVPEVCRVPAAPTEKAVEELKVTAAGTTKVPPVTLVVPETVLPVTAAVMVPPDIVRLL